MQLSKILILILLSATCLIADGIYNTMPNDKEAFAFKKGFSLAITSLIDGREYRLQGREESSVNFKDYLVMIDTTDLDDADKFAIQKIGFIYANSIRLNDERIVIADFERKANAATLAKTLNNNYFNKNAPHRRAYVYEKKNTDIFYKEKSFFYEIANFIEEKLKKEMEVVYITAKEPQPVQNQAQKSQNIAEEQKNNAPQPTPSKSPQATPIKITPKVVQSSNNQKTQSTAELFKDVPAKLKNEDVPTVKKTNKTAEKESKINTDYFFIQFLPTGDHVTPYKLIKDIKDKHISNLDLAKQSQTQNVGDVFTSENYIITTDDIKFYQANNGLFYKASECEVIVDFVNQK